MQTLKHCGRRIWLVVLMAMAMLAILTAPAFAYTVTGGTPDQRAYLREALASAKSPTLMQFTEARFIGFEVVIEPLWQIQAVAPGAVGWARSDGEMHIADSYTPGLNGFFGEIAIHEFGHLFTYASRSALAWRTVINQPEDGASWYEKAIENQTEHIKVAFFPPEYTNVDTVRTKLRVVSPETTIEFYRELLAHDFGWELKMGAPNAPFLDLGGADDELLAAAVWAKDNGYMMGHLDGTFRPYDPMLRRHVFLVAYRLDYQAPASWNFDYTVATRAEVRDAFPGLAWLEERWEEPITRSQLLRLIYRAYAPEVEPVPEGVTY